MPRGAVQAALPFVPQRGMRRRLESREVIRGAAIISHPRARTGAAGQTSISVRALKRFAVEVVSRDTTLC